MTYEEAQSRLWNAKEGDAVSLPEGDCWVCYGDSWEIAGSMGHYWLDRIAAVPLLASAIVGAGKLESLSVGAPSNP